jgi:hypothetical protein
MSRVSTLDQVKIDSLSKNWNVEGDIVAAASISSGSRIPGGPSSQIRAIKQMLYHHVNHPVAGTASVQFFNEAAAVGVTNVNQGQIPAQQVFALESIGLELVTGMNRDASTNTIPNFSNSIVTNVAVLEQKRLIMESSSFELKLGSEVLFECCGLDLLPYGGGIDAVATCALTTGAVAYGTNGAPFAGNRRMFGDAPHLLPAGSQLSAKITIPTTTVGTLPSSATSFWKLALFGTIFRK